jgi:nicotinamide-nucleotide adenylyltransferase
MNALLIGRFQPFHLGHLFALKEILKAGHKPTIVIGSIDKHDEKNPFTFKERKKIIQAVLKAESIKAKILGLKDYPTDKEWEQVLKHTKFDIIFSADDYPWLQDLKVIKIKRHNKISATKIRFLIRHSKPWQHLVHKAAIRHIPLDKLL